MAMTDFSISRSRWLAALLTASALLGACDGPPVVRQGPAEQRVVARTYRASAQTIRADVLAAFSARRATLPSPFNQMTVSELMPPRFSPDWFATFVDLGGFLEDYKRLAPEI